MKRILLIAQDFPPSGSPQALRWDYLSREFAAAGYDVHALTSEPPLGTGGLLGLPAGVRVPQVSGGPITRAVRWLEARHDRKLPAPTAGPVSDRVVMSGHGAAAATDFEPSIGSAARLNWKGRLVVRAKNYLSEKIYPDSRGEWLYAAKRALRGMIADRPHPSSSSGGVGGYARIIQRTSRTCLACCSGVSRSTWRIPISLPTEWRSASSAGAGSPPGIST